MQRELARAIGIDGATLTHHLNRMEAAGLISRTRDPENRHVHQVEFTDEGQACFDQLRGAAMAFDRRLRAGMSDEATAALGEALRRLRDNVAPSADSGE